MGFGVWSDPRGGLTDGSETPEAGGLAGRAMQSLVVNNSATLHCFCGRSSLGAPLLAVAFVDGCVWCGKWERKRSWCGCVASSVTQVVGQGRLRKATSACSSPVVGCRSWLLTPKTML